MIRGIVNAANEAVIPLPIRAANGQTINRDAVIDTGFSGYLTLSPAEITSLQLPFQQRRIYQMADGRQVEFDTYLVTVLWDGQERQVPVLEFDGGTLVGMRMLRGYTLFVDAVNGGEVRIEARP